jgi:hypothetical protein
MQAACSGQGLQKQGLEGRLWIPQMGNAQLKEQPSTLELIRLSTKRTVGMWHVSTRFLLRGFVANGCAVSCSSVSVINQSYLRGWSALADVGFLTPCAKPDRVDDARSGANRVSGIWPWKDPFLLNRLAQTPSREIAPSTDGRH